MQDKVDFPIFIHANMMADYVRVDKYLAAIRAVVKPKDVVVDIGCGTGVLTEQCAMIANHTHAVDICKTSCELTASATCDLDNISIFNHSSYDVCLTPQPSVLISETIGSTCFEEHIVPVCWDVVNRHKTIDKIIPSTLSLYCLPIASDQGNIFLKNALDKIKCYDLLGKRRQESFTSILTESLVGKVIQTDLSDAAPTATPILLNKATLGVTPLADFNKTINYPPNTQFLHFYFEADLCSDLTLSSRFDCPMTHWMHSFCLVPTNQGTSTIQYTTKLNKLQVM